MLSFSDIIIYFVAFLALYVQVFLFITFLEEKDKIKIRKNKINLKNYPKVSIIVPCYNEEKTISNTVKSLLDLEYPKEKLEIILINDGSIDNTLNELLKFKNISQIKIFSQKNGGKHTAVNLGIKISTGEIIGGLDSDSFVDKYSLERIISCFQDDPKTMAVCPSIIVHKPKNFLQLAQSSEYDMAIFTKKMLAFLGAIHVTPGPFSFFRKEVFEKIGNFKKAHNTEDQEIALRMQQNNMKIDHCVDAYVYTRTPDTILKLFRQRLRWIYGFIKNAIDYKHLIFKKKYGMVGTLTLPAGFISIGSFLTILFLFLISFSKTIAKKIEIWQIVGFSNSQFNFNFDWFFISTKITIFMSIIIYSFVIFSILIGRKILYGKTKLKINDLYFFIIYNLIAPFWLIKAVFNAIRSKESNWISERKI